MSNMGRRLARVAAVGVGLVGAAAVGGLPAGASMQAVVSAPAKGLISAAQASALGFAKTASKPTTTTKTGVSGCPKGAEAAYEDSAGATGLISEVLVCKSASGPAGLIKKAKKTGSASASMSPPKQLGTTAIERAAQGSTYAIYWQRGNVLAVVALDANVPASSSSTTTTTTGPTPPLTAQQQKTLTAAALKQDAALR
jgi:hypothetical protein